MTQEVDGHFDPSTQVTPTTTGTTTVGGTQDAVRYNAYHQQWRS